MPYIGNVTTSSNVNGSQINNGTITGDKLSLPFDYDSATLYLDNTNNRVGILTASPSSTLTVGTGGVVSIPLASAATPSLVFGTDTNTGIYSPGADQVAISTNGTGRLVIDANGNLLAGTGALGFSGKQLTLKNGQGYIGLQVSGTESTLFSSWDSAATPLLFSLGGTERMRLDSSGRLGLGTSGPSSILHVNQPGDNNGITLSHASRAGIWKIYHSGVSSDNLAFFQNNGTSDSLSYLMGRDIHYWATGGTERVRIDSSGRVGIGTTTVSEKLHVDNGGNDVAIRLSRGAQYGTFGADSTGIGVKSAGADPLYFSVNGTERFRCVSSGEHRMFSTNSTYSLVIGNGSTAGTSYLFLEGRYSATDNSGATGTRSFVVWSNGNVQNTNNSYTGISDIKLKENIVDASSQWDDIKALLVRNYNLKEGQTHRQIGLIAQEVEPISPGLVYESPDRDEEGNDLGTVTKSVNYSVLYMKAVKALQEAMERIETLEARLTAAGIA